VTTFANYAAFRVAVQWLIEGDELTDTFSVNTLDLIIGMGEARVYRELRASSLEAALSVVVSGNVAALPSDLLELKEVYFDATRPLEIVPLDRLRKLQNSSAGQVIYAAQDGDTLTFWPPATGTLLGKYYKKPAALSTALSTTFTRYPEVFIYAALVESAPFLGQDSRMQLWEAKYGQCLADAKHNELMRVYGGSPLRMRAR